MWLRKILMQFIFIRKLDLLVQISLVKMVYLLWNIAYNTNFYILQTKDQ